MPSLCGIAEATRGGSGLSLSIPSWHATFYNLGEFEHRLDQTDMLGLRRADRS
jgi:hypothetical protein